MININELLTEVSFNFSRSGGKGGQNVNKVETKVELVFNLNNSNVFNVEQKELLLLKLKNRIDGGGNLRITSQSERTQLGNRKKVIEKFKNLIEKSLQKRKKRIKIGIPKAVKEKILESKKKQSEKKQQRRKVEF
jgi:ribosome-associated protein